MRDHHRPARALSLAGLSLLVGGLGCDPGPPPGKYPVHPVEGRVLLDGKPVADAQVSLLPLDPSKFGDLIPRPLGQTDEDGRFQLMTYYAGDGAPEGDYLVAIAGLARPQGEAGDILGAARNAGKVDVLRGRFADPKTSGLKANIKPGPNALGPFDLKGSGGAAPAVPSDTRSR